ncbi:MAG: zf-TFIIB domain-containing protein [Anaerolineales bacterium]|jgi:Zn-finger nucleic acid-binding protein
MECPIDGTTLETHTIHSVKIEECAQCKGLWFEEGELRKAKDESELDLNWLDFDLWSDRESFNADWSSRKCPQCGKNMTSISYATTEVIVEYCVEGHGVWLDKGEFQAIIESLHQEILSKDVSDYVSASLKEAMEIFVGDEGFISEWKDFLTVTRLLQYRILVENTKIAELLIALQKSSPF